MSDDVPSASRVRPFPTGAVLPSGLPVSGEILTNHVGSIDVLARPVHDSGAIPTPAAQTVRARLQGLLTI